MDILTGERWQKIMNNASLQLAEKIRKEWGELDTLRDQGLSYPDDVIRYENVAYGTGDENHVLDIYVKKGIEPIATIVHVHGGAWVYSNKEFYKHYCLSLAERGFGVINFNYRLAPEHPYPAALQDTNLLFEWLIENGERYGIDCNKITIMGDSSGAHIAAQYATMWSNCEYAELCGIKIPRDLVLHACVMNCGIYDILHTDLGEIQGVVAAYLNDEPEKYELEMDIMRHVTEKFPPTYVMTASQDFVKNCSKDFCECLSQSDVPYQYRLYGEEEEKQYEHVFHCDVKLPEATVCNDEECEFLKNIFADK